MRPTSAHQQTSPAHSRPSSRSSSHSNSTSVPANTKTDRLAVKAVHNAASGRSEKRGSKKPNQGSHSGEDLEASRPVQAQTPGLISLTKPLADEMQASSPAGTPRSKKGKDNTKVATDSPAGTPIKNGRSKKKPYKVDSSVDLLSKSAPTESSRQQMRNRAQNVDSVTESSGLTWQQELLATKSTPEAAPSKSRRSARQAEQQSTSRHDGNLAQPQKVGQDSSLTWQQELFNSQKHHSNDVFADARDAETFGEEPSSNAASGRKRSTKRRPRAGSFGSSTTPNAKSNGKTGNADYPLHIDDLFDSSVSDSPATAKSSVRTQRNVQYSSHGAPIHYDASTPAKKIPVPQHQHPAVAAAIAYAGPNFHNSPSPASLPAPKFQSRLAKNNDTYAAASSSSGDSGTSDGESELVRGTRSTTAPAQIKSSAEELVVAGPSAHDSPASFTKASMQPGATVESLLAKMMGGARFT